MDYIGHTQGNVVILAKPLPIPDGTEVRILLPTEQEVQPKKSKKRRSLVMETFGIIPAAPAIVRQVLAEDLYEA
jgi:hypothetical protein